MRKGLLLLQPEVSKRRKAQLPRNKIIVKKKILVKELNPAKIFLLFGITVSQLGTKLILPEKLILSDRLLSLNCNMRVTLKTQRMSLKTQPKGFLHHPSVYKPSSTLYIND